MTPAEAIERLTKLRDVHDQTARTGAIAVVTEYYCGKRSSSGDNDTKRFIDLMIDFVERFPGA